MRPIRLSPGLLSVLHPKKLNPQNSPRQFLLKQLTRLQARRAFQNSLARRENLENPRSYPEEPQAHHNTQEISANPAPKKSPNMVTPSTKDAAAAGDVAPQTMNLTDRTARRQRASSIQSDSDPTSSSGSSSEEDSDSDDDEHHSDHGMDGAGESPAQQDADSIPQIGGRPKPRIHRFEGNSDIMSRLTSFLPQMKTANEDLQKQIDAGNADDLVLDNADGNGERYIEMVCHFGAVYVDWHWLTEVYRTLVLEFWKKSAMAIPVMRVTMKGPKMKKTTRISLGNLWAGSAISQKVISHRFKRWRNDQLFDLVAAISPI